MQLRAPYCGLCGVWVQEGPEGLCHIEQPSFPHQPDLIEYSLRLTPQINGRWGALVFWARGNDGLTYWQRRRMARRWVRGQGRLPSREESKWAYENHLSLKAQQGHNHEEQEEQR